MTPPSQIGVTLWQSAMAITSSAKDFYENLLWFILLDFKDLSLWLFKEISISTTSVSVSICFFKPTMLCWLYLAPSTPVNYKYLLIFLHISFLSSKEYFSLFGKTSFLKIMSFWVKVPVLSVKIYPTLPSYSGIFVFLQIVPGIFLSVLM